MAKNNSRIDSAGRAYAGSQLQIQTLVNEYPDMVDERLNAEIPALASSDSFITWVSPLEANRYEEYKDKDFLDALGVGYLAHDLSGFWPRSGPRWDALAQVSLASGNSGVILVEAKSYPQEAYSGGCKASSFASRSLIEQSLESTRNWLAGDPSADWTGPLYQFANRLAHLYFLREIVGVPAWLVNIYFANDPHRSTSQEEWHAAIPQFKLELGLPDNPLPNCIELIIEAPIKG